MQAPYPNGEVSEPIDDIVSTGGTSLRHDPEGGQFIQKWKTPKRGGGKCYQVTLTTIDGSTLMAQFELK